MTEPVPGVTDLPPQQPAGLARFATATLASLIFDRLFALALTVVMSAAFGTTRELDDYLLAVVGPLLITTLLSDVLYSLLLPELMSREEAAGRPSGWDLMVWGAAGLVLIAAVYGLLWWIGVGAASSNAGRLVSLGFITSPVIVFGGISTVGGTVLIARQRYVLASVRIPIASVVTLISFLVWARVGASVTGLAFSVLAGWVASAAVMVAGMLLVTGLPRITMAPAGAVGLLRRLAGPSLAQLVAGIAAQAPTPIERLIAFPLGAGVVSSLNYGRVLVSPPLLVAQSIATAAYPRFVGLKSIGGPGSYEALGRLIGMMVFLLLPLTVLFAGLSHPLVQLVYHRGAFDQQAVIRTSVAAAILAVALVPLAVGAVLIRFLYAERAPQRVARASVLALVAYVVLAVSLGLSAGYVGLAIANTGFYLVLMTVLLMMVGRTSPNGLRFVPGLSILRALLAAAVTAIVVVIASAALGADDMFIASLVHILVAGVLGALAYAAVSLLLRSTELIEAIAIARRAIPRPGP